MNPSTPTPDAQLSANLELVLLGLGVVMTVGVLLVVVWLVRTMRREDREEAKKTGGGGA